MVNAYGAAEPKAWISVRDHNSVAKVLKPVGRSIKVAGSSFIAVRTTRSVPAAIPGHARRPVTVHQARSGPRPRLRAVDSKPGGTWAIADLLDPMALGRKSTA
jgi:hypothetical protein